MQAYSKPAVWTCPLHIILIPTSRLNACDKSWYKNEFLGSHLSTIWINSPNLSEAWNNWTFKTINTDNITVCYNLKHWKDLFNLKLIQINTGKATISKCEICRYLFKLLMFTVQVEETENATIFQALKFSDNNNQGIRSARIFYTF